MIDLLLEAIQHIQTIVTAEMLALPLCGLILLLLARILSK